MSARRLIAGPFLRVVAADLGRPAGRQLDRRPCPSSSGPHKHRPARGGVSQICQFRDEPPKIIRLNLIQSGLADSPLVSSKSEVSSK